MIPTQPLANEAITAVILAGGRGSRLGHRDKGLVEIAGKPIVQHLVEGLRSQVTTVIICANRNRNRYAEFGRVISDELEGFQGPLAGMHSALKQIDSPYLLTVPCDAPILPVDYARRMWAAGLEEDADIVAATDGQRLQPVYALIRRELESSLHEFLSAGDRKIDLWYARHRLARADFSDQADAFRNINTPEEETALKRLLEKR